MDEHSSDFYVLSWPPFSPHLNHIENIWDALEQGVKGHYMVSTNLTGLLLNIGPVIPVERFQKLVEYMPRRVAAVIEVRGGPSR
ncbi:transposable element Tcb2 transposase [Trichonephila clavipes]|nr:transposable element Tcb2 transposase [Trichonephila clavipes]